jgi:hypothetical protein
MQIPAITLAQELIESSIIRLLRNAVRCAIHRAGNDESILTAADLTAVQHFK